MANEVKLQTLTDKEKINCLRSSNPNYVPYFKENARMLEVEENDLVIDEVIWQDTVVGYVCSRVDERDDFLKRSFTIPILHPTYRWLCYDVIENYINEYSTTRTVDFIYSGKKPVNPLTNAVTTDLLKCGFHKTEENYVQNENGSFIFSYVNEDN